MFFQNAIKLISLISEPYFLVWLVTVKIFKTNIFLAPEVDCIKIEIFLKQ